MAIGHIALNVTDIEKSRDFYLAALKPLGYKLMITLQDGKVLGFGTTFGGPDFWISALDAPSPDGSDVRHGKGNLPTNGPPREKTGKMHIAWSAGSRAQVRKFYEAAIAAGGICNGPPGPREEYFMTYYGAFILDPEGRNIEAVCMKPRFWAESWGFLGWGAIVASVAAGYAKWTGMI